MGECPLCSRFTLPSVLADEPTGDVDSPTARELMELIAKLNHDLGTTFVLVTHNEQLGEYASRIRRLEDGRLAP